MGHCHELSQGRVPEDGVVREADAGDVEVDQLGAVVVARAEGDGKADLSQRAGSATTSWGELRDLFTARYAAPAHHAVSGLLGGSQASPSDRHIKPESRCWGT